MPRYRLIGRLEMIWVVGPVPVGRDPGAFDMEPDRFGTLISAWRATSHHLDGHVGNFVGGADQGGEEGGYPGFGQPLTDLPYRLWVGGEIMTPAAVDLEVDETRSHPLGIEAVGDSGDQPVGDSEPCRQTGHILSPCPRG